MKLLAKVVEQLAVEVVLGIASILSVRSPITRAPGPVGHEGTSVHQKMRTC